MKIYSSKNYVIFDFGASSGRTITGTYDGKKISFNEIHRFENRPVFINGVLYWDILRLYSELKVGLLASVINCGQISGIGVDTWGVDFSFLDEYGSILSNPVHYRDARTNGVMEKVFSIIPKDILFRKTGCYINQIMSLFQLYSVKLLQPLMLKKVSKFLMMPDLFNYFLTGIAVTEETDAGMTLLLNLKTKKWVKEIIEIAGIPYEIMPELISAGTIIDKLQDSVCKELEITKLPVIAPATHDTSSAVTGIPIREPIKDWVFISAGTWCILGVETAEPILNPEVLKYGFANEIGVDGSYHFLSLITGLWILEECRRKWIMEDGKKITWEELDKLSGILEKSVSFKCFIDVGDQRFSSPQNDMPEVIINFCKETGQTAPESRSEILRCIYLSLTLRFKKGIESLKKFTNRDINKIYMVGGGVSSKLLCQLTANITGLEVIAGPKETTAIGNMIMQLKATGEINSLQEGRILAANSTSFIFYEPEEIQLFKETYNHYLKLIKKV
ncbi:MAG: rhamnulokinase [Candidatus Humimicrobiaceae bacterium]